MRNWLIIAALFWPALLQAQVFYSLSLDGRSYRFTPEGRIEFSPEAVAQTWFVRPEQFYLLPRIVEKQQRENCVWINSVSYYPCHLLNGDTNKYYCEKEKSFVMRKRLTECGATEPAYYLLNDLFVADDIFFRIRFYFETPPSVSVKRGESSVPSRTWSFGSFFVVVRDSLPLAEEAVSAAYWRQRLYPTTDATVEKLAVISWLPGAGTGMLRIGDWTVYLAKDKSLFARGQPPEGFFAELY